MNNAFVQEEPKIDRKPMLRQREQTLQETVEAIEAISQSNYWQVLKNNVFDGLVETLGRKLADEKEEIEIHRLQGQIAWARKFSNFKSLADAYRLELTNIRKQINE